MSMKANRVGDVVYTDKNLPTEKMKEYFERVGKNITDSKIQEGTVSLSFAKGRSCI